LLYFTEFDSFAGHSVTVVEDRLILWCRISFSTFGQNWPTLQRGLSATAELPTVAVWQNISITIQKHF